MAMLSFSQQVGYHWMCVIPAEALSPETVDDDPLSLLFVSCAIIWRAFTQVRHAKLKEAASIGIGRMWFRLQRGWLQAVPDMIWAVLHRRRRSLVSVYPASCAESDGRWHMVPGLPISLRLIASFPKRWRKEMEDANQMSMLFACSPLARPSSYIPAAQQ